MAKQITHNNHYVPQFYLKYWSLNGNTVRTYNGIVRHKACQDWTQHSIKSTACWPDYYTDEIDGYDDDKVERLFQQYECKSREVFERARTGKRLTDKEINILVDYLISQIVRTPVFYYFTQAQTKELFRPTLEEVINRIEKNLEKGFIPNNTSNSKDSLETFFPLKIDIDNENGLIKAETCLGRHSFLHAAVTFLDGEVAHLLRQSNWKILETNRVFLTSDNPVVIMQRRGIDKFSLGFDAGLINYPTYIYLPLTPHHLLVTDLRASKKQMDSFVLSSFLFNLFQQGIIYNAHRYIYAIQDTQLVNNLRPQIIDPIAFDNLQYEMKTWHEAQLKLERDFFM